MKDDGIHLSPEKLKLLQASLRSIPRVRKRTSPWFLYLGSGMGIAASVVLMWNISPWATPTGKIPSVGQEALAIELISEGYISTTSDELAHLLTDEEWGTLALPSE